MILGHVRDNFPYVTLALPGERGRVHIEFILDTGFDGELAVPPSLLSGLDAVEEGDHPVQMADGTLRFYPHYTLSMDWEGEERIVEIVGMNGRPLLGGQLLEGCQISIDMRDGGEVVIEPS